MAGRVVGGKLFLLQVFGKHNHQNIGAMLEACKQLALEPEEALQALADFKGAALRMQVLHSTDHLVVIRDYAHASSNLKATLVAATKPFRNRQVVACYELHTYSSLKSEFLSEYAGCLRGANKKIVFVDEQALIQRKRTDGRGLCLWPVAGQGLACKLWSAGRVRS